MKKKKMKKIFEKVLPFSGGMCYTVPRLEAWAVLEWPQGMHLGKNEVSIMKIFRRIVPLVLSAVLLAGSASALGAGGTVNNTRLAEVTLADAAVPLAGASNTLLLPVASGTSVKKNSRAIIDYSNTQDGYVMVQFTASTSKKLKVQVSGPTRDKPYYDLKPGEWTTFPLSDGNGTYKVTVFENTTAQKYAEVVSVTFKVTLSDEFAPYLRPNQYVDYENATNTLAKAKELAGSETDPLKLVEKVYTFVVNNLTYDRQLAATVQSGYLPVLDNVLAAKKGICFDYASLMTGMLRSLGVPCKLVVGYAGTTNPAYHAWISVWTEETGWIDNAIYFDGSTWHRMDPTFASSGKSSSSILKFIGDGSHYKETSLY